MKCFQRKRGCSSAQLSFNSAVSKKNKNGSKLSKQSKAKMKPFPHIKPPSHFPLGCSCLVGYRQMKGFLLHPEISRLHLLVSNPAPLPLASWTGALRPCSLLHKHSCWATPPPPRTLFTKVSTRLAIRASHRLFDAELADWAEPALLNVTLIVLNCLNFTLLSLFKHYPCVSHEAHLYAFTLVGSEEYCVFCSPLLGTISALTSPFLQCNKGLIFTP